MMIKLITPCTCARDNYCLTSLYCDTPVKVAMLVASAESAMEEASSSFITFIIDTKSIPAMNGNLNKRFEQGKA